MRFLAKLYPLEQLVLFFLLLTVLAYSLLGLELRNPRFLYLQRIQSGALLYLCGLGLCIFLTRLLAISEGRRVGKLEGHGASWQRFRKYFLNRSLLLRDLRLLNAIALMFTVFVNMKHLTPYLNAHLYDTAFAEIDRLIFAGKIGVQWTQELFGPDAVWWMSDAYTCFYSYTGTLIVFFILLRGYSSLGQEFLAAFSLIWFLGILMVYLLPSWGPCFFYPDTVLGLPQSAVSKMQGELWYFKLRLDEEPFTRLSLFLISGLPSKHVAVVLLGCIYLARVRVWLAVVSWIFLGLTVLSTIYFGWHYLIDDLAAIALVYLAIRGARLFNYSADNLQRLTVRPIDDD